MSAELIGETGHMLVYSVDGKIALRVSAIYFGGKLHEGEVRMSKDEARRLIAALERELV
jgi:hypothetical protein